MAFQERYNYTFRDNTNTEYTVELWQDTPTSITASGITAGLPPFVVNYPPKSNKLDIILGSGCDMTLLSVDSLQFLDLYTSDMMEYKIKMYSGATLLWTGYLDSELYSEPFNEYNNYNVNLTGNDGLALLDRLDYLDSTGGTYTGVQTNWTIIQRILGKIGLSWNQLYVKLSTTSTHFSLGTGESILWKTFSRNENYYDEDGVPMSCKEVLENILAPFSAFIQIINATVYLSDINTYAAGGIQTFIKYDGDDYSYVGTESIDLDLGDISIIGLAAESQTLNIISPINKQKITFSSYEHNDVFDYDTADDIFTGNTYTYNYGTGNTTWTEVTHDVSNYFSVVNTPTNAHERFSELTGTGANEGKTDKYLTIPLLYPPSAPGSHPTYFTLTAELPDLITSTEGVYYLKIDAKGYTRTMEDMDPDYSGNEILMTRVFTNLTLGNQKWKYDGATLAGSWEPEATSDAYFEMNFAEYPLGFLRPNWVMAYVQYTAINDKWTNLNQTFFYKPYTSVFIPLNIATTGGEIQFEILGGYISYRYDDDKDYLIYKDYTDETLDVRIKDIKFTIVDSEYNEIDELDIEYQAYVNKNVKDDGEDKTLNLGTNSNYNPSSYGGILYSSGGYHYAQSFTRGGSTDTIENLLARTIVSNYTGKTIEIQCTTNLIENVNGVLTYNNYLTGNFGLQGIEIDYSESTTNLTLQQIYVDDPTIDIQKNW